LATFTTTARNRNQTRLELRQIEKIKVSKLK
jgi:hypothetical protein